MKKYNVLVPLTGVVVGLAALLLVTLGNPGNMGFCIACFERDIAGSLGLHHAAKVQYLRPEILGLVLGTTLMALAGREFKARAGSAPALRFKTPLHNFFAFLLKYVFAAFFKVGSFAEFFRRIFLFIFVIIIIF